MEISSTLASQNYENSIPLIKPQINPNKAEGAENSFGRIASELIADLQKNENTVKDGLVGKADAHSVVEALAATEIAIETAVTVRDKVVEAYQEILRMPV